LFKFIYLTKWTANPAGIERRVYKDGA